MKRVSLCRLSSLFTSVFTEIKLNREFRVRDCSSLQSSPLHSSDPTGSTGVSAHRLTANRQIDFQIGVSAHRLTAIRRAPSVLPLTSTRPSLPLTATLPVFTVFCETSPDFFTAVLHCRRMWLGPTTGEGEVGAADACGD
ncbi:hypothetical protein LXL04_039746 [Taraxacum kok-saghyz]